MTPWGSLFLHIPITIDNNATRREKMSLKKATTFIMIQLLIISFLTGSLVYALESTDAGEEEIKTYTYEELLELAIKNSKELRRKEQAIERSEVVREEASRHKTYTPEGVGTGHPADVMARATLQGVISAEIGMQVAKKQVEIEEDKLAYDVKKAFNNLLLAQSQLELDRAEMDLNNFELKLANVQHDNGTMGRFELIQNRNTNKEIEKKLEVAKLALETAYLELNNLTGFKKDYRYNLQVEAKEEKELGDLEHHISRTLSYNPAIWSLEQSVKLAETALYLYSYNAGADPYKAKELDVSTAKLNVGNAKEMLEHSLRTLYQSMDQLKEARAILEINLNKAEESLKMARVKLEVGAGVPLEVKKVEKAVAELEHKIMENELQYEEILAIYNKPWVAAN